MTSDRPLPCPSHPVLSVAVRRIKAVILDWLPRSIDPLAFYYWKRPLRNLLALWVLSHICLYPGHWLLAMALLITAVMLWHIVIQVGCHG